MKPFLPFGTPGIFKAAAVVFFAYGGFDNIATMAEETKNPSRDIPIGLPGSMSITTAKYLVALGALKGMTTVLLVGALGQARYTTHIARAHMIPPWFAHVHPKTGTPINATRLIMISSAVIAFFSSLDVLATLLSVSTLFIFMMMAVALLVRRYNVRETTPQKDLLKHILLLLIIIASSLGTSAYWGLNPSGWVGYVITVPIWFLGTLGISLYQCFCLSRENRKYEVFHLFYGFLPCQLL
ncbi:hypothetical protein LWI28_006539 [Acer negundo]|uniref:Uncharacterized protein n=1 Tax=Acer negundo TaxID=4023 RepID=A0AAD5NJM9_ACENE|nr:hypothetical protein LWI28_006539 [Acer negundo]